MNIHQRSRDEKLTLSKALVGHLWPKTIHALPTWVQEIVAEIALAVHESLAYAERIAETEESRKQQGGKDAGS